MHIVDDGFRATEDTFLKNPFDCWMKLVLVMIATLYSLPDHSKIECDVISASPNGEVDTKTSSVAIGVNFSILLKLESLDWKTHKIDLFVPTSSGSRMLFVIDDEPRMYSIV